MPMPTKTARLLLRSRKGREPVWVIRDAGQPERSTGTGDRQQAEIALADYIHSKPRGPLKPDEMTIAEALSIYAEEHAPTVAQPERIGYLIQALLPFWGALTVSSVKGATCRRYLAVRKKAQGTMRLELSCLGAALQYCAKEGYLITAPMVTLPPKTETSQRALTRGEAAKLLWAARHTHVARFILIALYTGTRKEAILNLRLSGPSLVGGWFDLENGILYRKGEAERSTKKRRTPSRIPRQLLAHARRWKGQWAIEWRGSRNANINTAWQRIIQDANLGWHVTPHTLKHTAITWAISNGANAADAAAYFGTSIGTIEQTYWHHSPYFQNGALVAIEGQTGAKRR